MLEDEEPVVDGGDTDALGGTISQPEVTSDGNPAWSNYLEKFPESVKHIAREAFTEWDAGVSKKFAGIHEQYKPFKHFLDEGVDPSHLENAYGIAQMLENDPPGFARLLAQQLGLTIQEAEDLVEENQDDGSAEVDPRFAQMQDQYQQLAQQLEQRDAAEQQAQQVQQQQIQMENEFSEIENTHGKMTLPIKNQVMREALRLSYESDEPVSMAAAYSSLEGFVREIRGAPRPGQLAPSVLHGGSSATLTPPAAFGKMTPKQTREYVAEMIARQNTEQ